MAKTSPYSFIVLLPNSVIEIPQSSNLSWLTLFYALPKELVWDCYAWAACQYFQIPHKDGTYHDIPGDWLHYSGDFPLWRVSYEIIKHFRKKFEAEMEWSF